MQGKQRSPYKIKRRKLLTEVKGNRRGEDPPLNQLLQGDLTASNLTGDELLTTFSATDTGKGCRNTEAEASAAGLCEGREIHRESLAGLGFASPRPTAISPTSWKAAGLPARLACEEQRWQLSFRKHTNPSSLEAFKRA